MFFFSFSQPSLLTGVRVMPVSAKRHGNRNAATARPEATRAKAKASFEAMDERTQGNRDAGRRRGSAQDQSEKTRARPKPRAANSAAHRGKRKVNSV